jgi:hypothetical protein
MKPSADHQGGRYTATITFDMPSYVPTHNDLRAFIKEALESMGGCRHPNDPLFHSLGQVTVTHIKRKEPS